MVEKKTLEDVGKDHGITPEQKSKKGRKLGVDIGHPNLKTMTKKDLISEAGKSRKHLKELEGKLAEIAKQRQEAEADLVEVIPPEIWAVLPMITYDLLSLRFGEHWRLNEKETMLYGKSIEGVVNRYLGVLAGDNPEVFALVMVAVGTAIPRIMITAKVIMKEKAKPEKKAEKKPSADENRS